MFNILFKILSTGSPGVLVFSQHLVSVVGVCMVGAVALVGNLKEDNDSGLQVIDDSG